MLYDFKNPNYYPYIEKSNGEFFEKHPGILRYIHKYCVENQREFENGFYFQGVLEHIAKYIVLSDEVVEYFANFVYNIVSVRDNYDVALFIRTALKYVEDIDWITPSFFGSELEYGDAEFFRLLKAKFGADRINDYLQKKVKGVRNKDSVNQELERINYKLSKEELTELIQEKWDWLNRLYSE